MCPHRFLGYVDDEFWDDMDDDDRPRKRGRLPGTGAGTLQRRRVLAREGTVPCRSHGRLHALTSPLHAAAWGARLAD